MSYIRNHYPLQVIGLFVFAVMFTFLRDYNAYSYPVMACEDGGVMFAYYTNHPSVQGIVRSYNGYISLLPNAVGYLSALVSPTLAPYVLAWYPLLLTGIAHSLFSLRRFRVIVADDRSRLFVCFWLTLFPVGYALLVSNTTYSLWNLLWILLLLVYAPVSPAISGQVVQFVFMLLAIWSHPLSILVLPLCIYNFLIFRDRGNRLMNIGIVVAALAYQIVGVERHSSQLGYIWQGAVYTILYLLDQVAAVSLIGDQLRLDLYTAGHLWLLHAIGLFLLASIGVVWFTLRHSLSKREHFQILGVIYPVIGVTALNAIGRLMDATSHMGPWNDRYFYVQQLLLLMLVAILYIKLDQHTKITAPVRVAILLISLLIIAGQNLHDYRDFRTPSVEGIKTANFLQQIEEERKILLPGQVKEFNLERFCFNIEVRYVGRT